MSQSKLPSPGIYTGDVAFSGATVSKAFTVVRSEDDARDVLVRAFRESAGALAPMVSIERLRRYEPTEGPTVSPQDVAAVLLEVGFQWVNPGGDTAGHAYEIPYHVAHLMRAA
ncbi:MAG TPA: hypothetical protein VD862_03620 [Candidatus Paceibacterota bacterium]|nr:hypothetical protein [Candidatus Paceibacterota bacterium]